MAADTSAQSKSPNVSVEKIAQLSYLELQNEEKERFQKQMGSVLAYVDQLQKVPMTDAEAKSMGAFHITNAFYEMLKIDPSENLRDENSEAEVESLNLSNEEALKNSPKSGGIPGELLFEVPSIIER